MTKATDAMRAANIKHGRAMGDSRRGEYEAWRGAKNRCYNPKHKRYARYGGRGIEMDARWREDFNAFLADMGMRPSPKHTLDRIDNDGPYSPDNCRWATRKRQNRNRSTCMMVKYQGRKMSLVDACELAGVPYSRVNARISTLGWDFERAITQPCRQLPKSRSPLRSRGFSPTRSALDRPSFNPEIMDGDHE